VKALIIPRFGAIKPMRFKQRQGQHRDSTPEASSAIGKRRFG
jgi:hypothetical protein